MCQAVVPHIPVVLVTLGNLGLMLCHSHGSRVEHPMTLLRSSPPPEASFHAVYFPTLRENTAITSVSGAGDCLSATFVAAMLEGRSTDECVRLSLNAAELSLASSDAVPGTISQSSVLDQGSRDPFPHWKPRVLKTG
ncbi:hypothetical protein EGW08_017917, partial [Elysia chlorotica]